VTGDQHRNRNQVHIGIESWSTVRVSAADRVIGRPLTRIDDPAVDQPQMRLETGKSFIGLDSYQSSFPAGAKEATTKKTE
jgi:hypothetical protein